MDVVALGLHYGARTGLYYEDPRSQNRDPTAGRGGAGHPSDFLRVFTQTLKAPFLAPERMRRPPVICGSKLSKTCSS
jgi:hypothetical protein